MKAWRLPPYQALGKPFPYRVESRISSARTIFEYDGPLNVYLAEVDALIGHLVLYDELRHFMAHGLSIAEVQGDRHVLEYRLYRPRETCGRTRAHPNQSHGTCCGSGEDNRVRKHNGKAISSDLPGTETRKNLISDVARTEPPRCLISIAEGEQSAR